MSAPAWTFLVSGLVAAITTALGAYVIRRKTKAETADIITNAAGKLILQMETRVVDLERRLVDAERREIQFMSRIRELESEVHSLRIRLGEQEGHA